MKNGFRNVKNVKTSNWVIMRIFNERRCWFSKASKVLPIYSCKPRMKSIETKLFELSHKRCIVDGRTDRRTWLRHREMSRNIWRKKFRACAKSTFIPDGRTAPYHNTSRFSNGRIKRCERRTDGPFLELLCRS